MQRKRNNCLLACLLALPLQAQQNYVRTYTPLSAVTPGTPLETYTYRDDGKLKTYGGKDFKHTLYYDEDINLFGPPSYNGMITALGVKQAGNEYEFHMQYDGFNRLNGVASQGIPGGFKGFMSYDKNGNITSKYVGTLRKHINYIEFNYDGNHIKSTADIKGEHWPAEGYMDIFYEAHRDTTAYAYDKNGNEVRNLSQNVAHAHYNVLIQPLDAKNKFKHDFG